MKFRKSSLAAIVGCMVFVSPASAVSTVENICKMKPDGSIQTVRVDTMHGQFPQTYYFKNVATQYTLVLTNAGQEYGPNTYALNPGTYTLKWTLGINPLQATYPHTIVVRPYTLTPGQGTGCVLNVPVTGAGRKAERVLPRTQLPQ